jgi:hydrogenase maturation protease
MTTETTILLIGLGNPILGDDGVGWKVVEVVEKKLRTHKLAGNRKVEFEYLSLGGLSLMERMEGYSKVIVVDSILTGSKPNGTIYSLPLSSLPDLSAGHTTAIHDASLATALEVGRKMGMVLPEEVWVVAVEATQVFDFTEKLTPPVQQAVPKTANILEEILETGIMEEKIYDIA